MPSAGFADRTILCPVEDLRVAIFDDFRRVATGRISCPPGELPPRAKGFTVKLCTSYGLTDLPQYDACTRATKDGNDSAPPNEAVRTFDQVPAPGDSFEPPEPLTVRPAPHAPNERLGIGFEPGDGAQDIDSRTHCAALQIGVETPRTSA